MKITWVWSDNVGRLTMLKELTPEEKLLLSLHALGNFDEDVQMTWDMAMSRDVRASIRRSKLNPENSKQSGHWDDDAIG